ncbi:MAG: hypothetical protein ACYTHN_13230, partial [Planctomycetota bacterium]
IEYLRLVEKPRFGHGRGMNPCLDCRIYMLRKAREVMAEWGAHFVVTGEVLGQRPMSQHRKALSLIERESGIKGRILRPLSARFLPPTIPEQEGMVDRTALLAIRGRSRREQLRFARDKGIDLYSCPAGGCLLTDPAVSRRVRDLFRHSPDYDMTDARLLTFGRHFRIHDGLKAILGRDEGENERLERIGARYPRMELAVHPGPLLVAHGEMKAGDREILGRLIRFYAKKATGDGVHVRIQAGEDQETFLLEGVASTSEVEGWRI